MLILLFRILVVGSILQITACSGNNENQSQLNSWFRLNHGIIISTRNIGVSNNAILHAIEDRLDEVPVNEKAKIWKPKADTIHKISDFLSNHIEVLKRKLINEANGRSRGNMDTFDLDNRSAVQKVLIKEDEAQVLNDLLIKYKSDLMGLDPLIKQKFSNTIPIYNVLPELNKQAGKYGFEDLPLVAMISALSDLQNKIAITENMLNLFCLDQSTSSILHCGFGPEVLVHQNSTHLRTGEKMNISVGIGSFITGINPLIEINHKEISIGNDVMAKYSMIPSKPGKYNIPVKVTYTKPDGTLTTFTTKVDFTVTD